MTERQMKRVLRRIMDICDDLRREGRPTDEVAQGIQAIYTLVCRCID